MSSTHNKDSRPLSAAGFLIALGIIFGDIGTSPLYVMKAIVGHHPITESLVLGGLSCVLWTLILQTTVKYVLITLEADNHGEGGIFALYAIVRRKYPWLLFPAIIGGSTLLADGIITPPISVSSAIEGLRILDPEIQTIPIVILIITALFAIQNLGTSKVGKSFGPIMVVWFSMLLVLGLFAACSEPKVLRAFNPVYAFNLIFNYPGGFWLLGAVFLCTTGAEALYSDLGHCGKSNIRASWTLVKLSLLANYAGQSAWLLQHTGSTLEDKNPFYALMPSWFLVPGIAIATLATIIASQALISGSFTLVTEAMRLNVFPKFKIAYPTEMKGQLYVPFMNFLLYVGCIGVVLFFKESSNMEAAYGLSITTTMLMTTVLLLFYLLQRGIRPIFICLFASVYLSIEGAFLVANLDKFAHGGWVTFIIAGVLSGLMWCWYSGSQLKRRYTEFASLTEHLPTLQALSQDSSIRKYATHLIYMTGSLFPTSIERKIIYSLFQKSPKRADVYWFIHVHVVDEPYTTDYKVTTLIPNIAFRIDFRLGFRVEPRINVLFKEVIETMAGNNEVDVISRYQSLRRYSIPGDFTFIVLKKVLSYENDLPKLSQFIMRIYSLLRKLSLTEEKGFGLDTSSVVVETVPLILNPAKDIPLTRIWSEPPNYSIRNL